MDHQKLHFEKEGNHRLLMCLQSDTFNDCLSMSSFSIKHLYCLFHSRLERGVYDMTKKIFAIKDAELQIY